MRSNKVFRDCLREKSPLGRFRKNIFSKAKDLNKTKNLNKIRNLSIGNPPVILVIFFAVMILSAFQTRMENASAGESVSSTSAVSKNGKSYETFQKIKEFHVAPNGNDTGNGSLSQPFASLERAQKAVRQFKQSYLSANKMKADSSGKSTVNSTVQSTVKTSAQASVNSTVNSSTVQSIEVILHEGVYYLQNRLVFSPEDSGTGDLRVIWRSEKGKKAVISGGFPVSGWQKINDHLYKIDLSKIILDKNDLDKNDLDKNNADQKNTPEKSERKNVNSKQIGKDSKLAQDSSKQVGKNALFHESSEYGEFTQLFINNRRAVPARTPNEGRYFYTKELDIAPAPSNKCLGIFYDKNDAGKWLDDPESQIVLYYNWSNSHNRIESIDAKKYFIKFKRPGGQYFLGSEIRYYVTETFSALDAPGEWYYDKNKKILYYYPRSDENLDNTTAVVSRINSPIVLINGSPQGDNSVENIIFQNIAFNHANADLSADYPHSVQGAHTQKGALLAYGMKNVIFEDCEFAHNGEHGISLLNGCHNNVIRHCHIHDLGGGGVYLSKEGPLGPDPVSHTVNNLVENNIIHDGGYFYAAGCGVFHGGNASYNKILHNEIFDFSWVGIHAGWSWTGLVKAHTHHNEFGYNHIHHISNGVMNDVGGIYMLGVSTGTEVHHQYIHDVWRYTRGSQGYGGWGIYFDAGSSEIHVHDNIVSDTQDGGLHLHCHTYPYGDVVENNIFAFGKNGELMRNAEMESKKGLHVKLSKNIIYENNVFTYTGGNWHKGSNFTTDYNCFWTTAPGGSEFYRKDFATWQKEGNDQHGIVADPRFYNAEKRDFRLKPDSPVFKLGFQPIDPQSIGVYGDEKWKALAKSFTNRTVERARAMPEITRYWDDFENYKPGDKPRILTLFEENDKAVVRVSNAGGATGSRQALKIQDGAGQKWVHDPHVVYYRLFPVGKIHNSFDLKFESGAPMNYEWRDWREGPYRQGPVFTINSKGALSVNGGKPMDLPSDQWIHFDIWCSTGVQKTRTWKMAVTCPGRDPVLFDNLPVNESFERLNYLGFISIGEKEKAFYLDNLLIERDDDSFEGISKISSGINYEVLALQDGINRFPEDLFSGATASELHKLTLKGFAPGSFNSFLIYQQKEPVLIDTGCGGDAGTLVKKLTELGITPDKISAVLLTHCHGDHIGGLLDSTDKAIFPKATIYVCDQEKSYWENLPVNDQKSRKAKKVFQVYADRIKVFHWGETILGNIRCLDASGHTPGHTAYEVEDVCFIGDLVHGGVYQFSNPLVCARYDMDRDKAIAARIRIFNQAAKSGTLIFSAHLPAPGAGYIETKNSAFEFIPVGK